MAAQNSVQALLALDQWCAAQIIVVEEEKIEDVISEARFALQGVLQQLKPGSAVRVEGHQFAIDHGVALDNVERFGDRGVPSGHVIAIARIQGSVSASGFCNQSEAIPFRLENPLLIVERRVDQGCKHWLQVTLSHAS